MYKTIIRPILFLFSPEVVHNLVVKAIKIGFFIPGVRNLVQHVFTCRNSLLERNVFGIRFSNPIGLAAGFDKNAESYKNLSAFGFSFIEIGTVTPKPQPGNPRPRSFRLKKDLALINRMGFNNMGVLYVKEMLKKSRGNVIIGGNIGKNTDTPNHLAIDDYIMCFKELYQVVDYLVVNVSCPNITDLKELQDKEKLGEILHELTSLRKKEAIYKPILLKVSPDLTNLQLAEAVETARRAGLDGFVATNTTTSREGLVTDNLKLNAIGNGGLSGLP
ncbi:MAG: quinone-dependent dihydroorotate dehydrogenase, partial [Tenuifilaceae bacterium]